MQIDKENIFLKNTKESMLYTSVNQARNTSKYPILENPNEHIKKLKHQLDISVNHQQLSSEQVTAIKTKDGAYVEVAGQKGYDLKYTSLEDSRAGIQLLNVKTQDELTTATLFVPKDKSKVLLRKFDRFEKTCQGQGNPKNNDLVRSIETISDASVESFWYGNHSDIPNKKTKMWCEAWLRTDKNYIETYESFKSLLNSLNVNYKTEYITFPERMVMIIHTNYNDLRNLIAYSNQIAEFRKVTEPSSFFINEPIKNQKLWGDDFSDRLRYEPSNATVCLLDSGVAHLHPLIEPFIHEHGIQTVYDDRDLVDYDGHGTEMAGIILYHDLAQHLVSNNLVYIPYQLESSKILGKQSNEPEVYGAITQQGILLHEAVNPNSNRSVCMAVTSLPEHEGIGKPSSWSAAIDRFLAGVDVIGESTDNKRLMYISAGNVCLNEMHNNIYPNINITSSVENPGQSWNALTVGAYNSKINIDDPLFNGHQPVADVGELSPYSKTSNAWDNKWPIKPEILMDGGNMAVKDSWYTNCDDLSLLTTNHEFNKEYFSTIWATSSATAQASKLSAEIYSQYPNAWPETIRALMVHSARWTNKMIHQFAPSSIPSKTELRYLLRTCGYGIPNLERAVSCKNNYVNMIIEDELQPFKLNENHNIVMNEIHIHSLPWPKDVLESLENELVELRVTLSYYIEPSPGNIGWKDKYSYQSCGLRFDMKHSVESMNEFKKRINKAARETGEDWHNDTGHSMPWYLGVKNRNVGSIHSDFIRIPAITLANINGIAVYPVSGWWKGRKKLKKYNEKIRYSLIISLSTKATDVDLYTPIIINIQNPVLVPISH